MSPQVLSRALCVSRWKPSLALWPRRLAQRWGAYDKRTRRSRITSAGWTLTFLFCKPGWTNTNTNPCMRIYSSKNKKKKLVGAPTKFWFFVFFFIGELNPTLKIFLQKFEEVAHLSLQKKINHISELTLDGTRTLIERIKLYSEWQDIYRNIDFYKSRNYSLCWFKSQHVKHL